MPEDISGDKTGPLPTVPPVPHKRFISVTTDALQDEYSKFQDHQLPIVERVRAGHRFLGTAAGMLSDAKGPEDRELGNKVDKFLQTYIAPRIKISIVRTADDTPAYRLTTGGATEAFSDVAIQDLQAGLKAVEDQRHEEYYSKILTPVMGLIIVRLAKIGIVDEKPPELLFSFAHLTEPINIDDGDDDGDDDEEDSEDD